MRAAIYIRVSTTAQELSPAVQEHQAKAWCLMHNHDVDDDDVFMEIGVSGSTKFADRPEGAKLIARLAEFGIVVFTKLDRAFRSTVDCITTVERFREAGKAIAFLDMSIDTSTPAGGLCLQMMAALAEFERRRIGERIKESLKVVKEQGRKIGTAPYGFRNCVSFDGGRKVNGGVQEPVFEEQEVIKLIVLRREQHARLRVIAAELQSDGVPTRRGGKWSAEHVRKILERSA